MEGIVNTTGISEAGTVVLEMEVEDKVYLRMDLAHVEGINLPVPPAFSFFFCVACNFRSKNLMPLRFIADGSWRKKMEKVGFGVLFVTDGHFLSSVYGPLEL